MNAQVVLDTHELVEHLGHIEELLMEISGKLAQGAAGASSVEVKTSTRGVDITSKAYAGSPITEAGDAAMDEFIRVGREIEKRLMGQA
jgi:hypothetical protein